MALTGLLVSALLVMDAWRGGAQSGADDFGAVPAAGAPPGARASQTAPAASSAGAGAVRVPSPAASVPGPSELSLPRLRVRAPVDPVGVDTDGQVKVPGDPKRVGWYRFSPAPGSPEGSAVVVGHIDARGRGLGVLVALNQVRQGDRVLIGRSDGSTVEYRVTARRTVGKKALAGSGAFRRDGRPVLTLITCAGPYYPDRGGYQNNLVVTAVQVPR